VNKKIISLMSALLLSLPMLAMASGATVNVLPTGVTGQYLQATSVNNPLFHIQIHNSDSLHAISVQNVLNSWYLGSATEPGAIALNGVKMWYVAADTSSVFNAGTALYVTYLPTDENQGGTREDLWKNTLNTPLPVVDGSGIWITADISATPNFGTIEFQGDSISFITAGTLPAADFSSLPLSPPVMLITQTTPATDLRINHLPGTMQSHISTSQDNIIPEMIQFYNNSGPNSAPIIVNSLTITVSSNPPGTVFPPDTILGSIRVQDKDLGTVYGSADQAVISSSNSVVIIPMSLLNIPANTTITANVVISITGTAVSAGSSFVLDIPSPDAVTGYDFYTQKNVPAAAVPADSFPMYSNPSTIQKQCLQVNSGFYDTIPANINEGQVNVPMLKVVLANPGDNQTASGQAYNLRLQVSDSSNSAIIPSSLFSRVSVTDQSGSIIYGQKDSTLESSGGTINIPLLNTIGIPAASSVTVVVRANLNPSTNAKNFKIGIASIADIQARDVNSFIPSTVVTSNTMPFYSSLALLSSSLKISHQPKMPGNIFAGQKNLNIMNLNLTSPLTFGIGNTILARGITLTVQDHSGSAENASEFLSRLRVTVSSPSVSQDMSVTSFSGSTVYIPFQSVFAVTNTADTVISVFADISDAVRSGSMQVQFLSESTLDVYSYIDPSKQVFVSAASGDGFPMSSGTGVLSGDSSAISFTTYPNPFHAGSKANLSYYLSGDSQVTIKVFDISGALIKKIIEKTDRSKGPHAEDTWDGTDNGNRQVLAGTYLIKIESKQGGSTKQETRKITFIK
jgi:hypothetical protein